MLAYCAQEEVVGRWYSGVWKKVFMHFYGGKKLKSKAYFCGEIWAACCMTKKHSKYIMILADSCIYYTVLLLPNDFIKSSAPNYRSPSEC